MTPLISSCWSQFSVSSATLYKHLRETTRVLKPQGRLIIGMIDPDSPLGKSYEMHKERSKFYRHGQVSPGQPCSRLASEPGL